MEEWSSFKLNIFNPIKEHIYDPTKDKIVRLIWAMWASDRLYGNSVEFSMKNCPSGCNIILDNFDILLCAT